MDRKIFRLKNLHLIISVTCIIPIALVYGVNPTKVLFLLFDISIVGVNLIHIFRALMGLYFGMCVIWFAGIIKPAFWFTATIANICFMGGLAFGRLLSIALDGYPSKYFLAGLIAELVFALWGIKNLRKYEG